MIKKEDLELEKKCAGKRFIVVSRIEFIIII